MASIEEITKIILIGCGATLVMDMWLAFLKRIGVPTMNFALVGRWVGHLRHRQFAHDSISKASPIAHETLLGWTIHYATGIAFSCLQTAVAGAGWIAAPAPGIALLVGMGTVVFPLFVMQPAMGLGIAAAKTPTPITNCLKSLVNHSVFGAGLFLSACFIAWISR